MFTTPEASYNERNRPSREKALKWANLIVAVGTFLCFAIMTADVQQRAHKSVTGFWNPGTWKLDNKLQTLLEGCTYTGKVPVEGWHVSLELDSSSRDAIMAHSCALIRRAVWITGASVVLSALNKLLFDRNVHEYPVGEAGIFYIRKGWLQFLEIGCITWAIIALQQGDDECSYVSDYISNCTESQPGASAPDHIWKAPPFVPMFIALGATLLLHIITFAIYYKVAVSDYPPLPRRAWRTLAAIVALRKPTQGSSIVEDASYELLAQLKTLLSGELIKESHSKHHGHDDVPYANPLPPQQPQPYDYDMHDVKDQYESPAG